MSTVEQQIREAIQEAIAENEVILFMKGTPEAPRCGFSARTVATWALPFEALYQAGLAELTADTVGFTRLAIDLGPFGGAEAASPLLWPWTVVYLLGVGAVAHWTFGRQDL